MELIAPIILSICAISVVLTWLCYGFYVIFDLRSRKMIRVAEEMKLHYTKIIAEKRRRNYINGLYQGRRIEIFDNDFLFDWLAGSNTYRGDYSFSMIGINGRYFTFTGMIPPKKIKEIIDRCINTDIDSAMDYYLRKYSRGWLLYLVVIISIIFALLLMWYAR